MNFRFSIFLLLLPFLYCHAQIVPEPGARLNCTQVMFEHPLIKGADLYALQLKEDTGSFSFVNALTQKDSAPATMISGLHFGRKYQWRYAGIKSGKTMDWNGPYNFEIVTDTFPYQNFLSVKILNNDAANSGGLIAMDCLHSVVDRAGNLVWFLPGINWHLIPMGRKFETRPQIIDLHITPYGTITYLADSDATEADLRNHAIWIAPNDGKVSGHGNESYNHDFKRLPNGNYMVLGTMLWKELPVHYDSISIRKKYPACYSKNGKELARVEFGTILEYNKKKKLVWSWNSQNYFDRNMQSPPRDSTDMELKAHMNAFSVDRKNEFVYAGFRDISRIIKISKKSGEVVDSWGDRLKSGEAKEPGFFHRQHDAKILDDGTIAVFNNNNNPPVDSPSSVIIFSQPSAGEKSKVVWNFNCQFDTLPERNKGLSGGNVDEFKNHNLLICTGNGDRVFEITRDKKIVWDAVIENTEGPGHSFFHRLYRAHYISSLYPCYFTCQAEMDTLTKNLSSFSIKIFNVGSDDDAYAIHVTSGSGSYQKLINSPPVVSGHSASFEIRPIKNPGSQENIQILISSKTNPDKVRKMTVLYSK